MSYLICDVFRVILWQVPLQYHQPGLLLLQSYIIPLPLVCFVRWVDQSF